MHAKFVRTLNSDSAATMANEEDVDFCSLFSDNDSDSSANPDDEDWDSSCGLDTINTAGEIADRVETSRSRSTDGDTPGPSVIACSSSGKKKQLNKSEKKRLVDAVRQTDVDRFLVDILAQLDKQLHFTVFQERCQFLQTLVRSKDDLKLLCKAMIGDFCRVYESCDSGKEKYTRFVLQWHQHCSSFLMEPTNTQGHDADNSQQLWHKLSYGVDASIKKTL